MYDDIEMITDDIQQQLDDLGVTLDDGYDTLVYPSDKFLDWGDLYDIADSNFGR